MSAAMKRIMRHKFGVCLASVVGMMLVGCNSARDDGKALAWVNGQPITRVELDTVTIRTLGYERALRLDDLERNKVLESMVVSRAMVQAIEPELSKEEQQQLENEIAAFREQLLVKKYLRRHAAPRAVTEDMIRDYYDKHPERFGGKTLRNYEMIMTTDKPSEEERDNLLKALATAGSHKFWASTVKRMKAEGYTVQYRKGAVDEKILHPRLYALFNTLKVGETSEPTLIEGKPYLVRTISERKLDPRPLDEVRADARKILTLLELRKATKDVSDALMKNVKVKYAD